MQKRLLVFFGFAGALIGLAVLIFFLLQPPPEIKIVQTVEPPKVIPPPAVEEVKAVQQKGTIKGKVVNGDNDQPIAGATVVALKPYLRKGPDDDVPLWGQLQEIRGGGSRVKTAADGTFAIEDLPPNYWNLWVEKKGWAFTTVPRAKFQENHVIKLYPACSIRGKVIYEDDTPASGIDIEYTPQGTHSEVFGRYRLHDYKIKTDKNGEFEYLGLPPGKFTVEVYPGDHLPAPWTHEPPLKSGENRDLGVRRLTRGFGMKVYVKWRRSKKPVEGIEVVVTPIGDPMPRTKTGRRRHTNSDGLAVFSGLGGQVLPDPKFQIAANVPGIGPVMPDEQRLFAPNETVTVWLREDSTIKGTVQRPSGTPLERFFVELKPIGFLTRQLRAFGENGAFTMYSIPEGKYELIIRYPNYIDERRTVNAVAGKETDIGLVIMREGAMIRGRVRTSEGGVPDGRIRVHLARKVFNERRGRHDWETVKRGICDKQDGGYALKGVPPGKYFLWPENMSAISRTTNEVPVTVGSGQTLVEKDLILWGEGKLVLKFMDDVKGAIREVRRPIFTWVVEKRTGESIRWFGEGTALRPGKYEVYFELDNTSNVSQQDKRVLWKEVEIQEGETTGPIEVRLYEIRTHDK